MNNNKNNIYYAVNFDTNIPYEIFINGISIARSYKLEGQEGGYRILNPFIEKSGSQNILIKLFIKDKSFLSDAFLKTQNFELYSLDNMDEPNQINLIKKLTLNKDILESGIINLNFEATVPYVFSENLENFFDLTKEDSIALMEECKKFYLEAGNIINVGNKEKYKELTKHSIDREVKSLYYNNQEKQFFLKKIDSRISNSQGCLKSLQNYKLKIHPNKKIVSLVDENGDTPLVFVNNEKENKFSFLLYKKSASSKLEAY